MGRSRRSARHPRPQRPGRPPEVPALRRVPFDRQHGRRGHALPRSRRGTRRRDTPTTASSAIRRSCAGNCGGILIESLPPGTIRWDHKVASITAGAVEGQRTVRFVDRLIDRHRCADRRRRGLVPGAEVPPRSRSRVHGNRVGGDLPPRCRATPSAECRVGRSRRDAGDGAGPGHLRRTARRTTSSTPTPCSRSRSSGCSRPTSPTASAP